MSKKFFTCIFVNFNNSLESIKCIESILRSFNDFLYLKIFIVDNNSIDSEKDILKSYCMQKEEESVEAIFLQENVGYFPAIQYAYKNKYEFIQKSEYVIIGNNDLIFNREFFENLEKKIYTSDIFVVSPNIVNSDNNHQNPQVIDKYTEAQLLFLDLYHSSFLMATFINLISHLIKFRSSQKSKPGYDKSQYISIGYGACYVLTKEYILKVDHIPAYLFLMNEENALTNAVLQANGRIFYDSELIVNHLEHTTINISPKRKIYKIAQNSYKISKKYFNNRYLYDTKIVNRK